MKDYIWDGKIDKGWEEMKSYLIEVSDKFVQKALILANQSNNMTVQKLVNEKACSDLEQSLMHCLRIWRIYFIIHTKI